MSEEEGVEAIRAAKKRARKVPKLQVVENTDQRPPPPDDAGGRDDDGPEKESTLPRGCPVQPLGTAGDFYYFIDQRGQLRIVEDKSLGRSKIKSMFGALNHLLSEDEYWPRKKQDKDTGEWITTGWKPEDAETALMREASRRGYWSPIDRVRGRGAWLGQDGALILNCGDYVLEIPGGIAGEAMRGKAKPWGEFQPGLHGDMVYERGDRWLRPDPISQPALKGPAEEVLTIIRTWSWYRPEVDPILMLGWICAAMLGGALHWRVVAWLTGGHGTGKSSLERLLKWLFGGHGLLNPADATAPGIRQTLRHDSLPVAVDEAEPDLEGDNRALSAMVKLARNAASGALATRGSSDQKAYQSTIRSCMMFGSILMPDMTPADRSRLVIFELHPLGDKGPPELTEAGARDLGNRLMRRLVDNWHRFPATIAAYRDALRKGGHTARGQDVFGTLIACADLAMQDEMPITDQLQDWQEKLSREIIAELEDDVSDEGACLNLMLSTTIEQPHDRKRFPVGHWIGRAAGKWDGLDAVSINASNAVLMQYGLKVVSFNGEQYLAVANRHQGLARIFEGSRWRASPGGRGGWVQALRRLKHIKPKVAMYFGAVSKATLLGLDLCLPARPAAAPKQDGSAAPGAVSSPPAAAGDARIPPASSPHQEQAVDTEHLDEGDPGLDTGPDPQGGLT